MIGEYIPTPKNKMVEMHYANLGFSPLEASDQQYVLDLESYTPRECYITKREEQ
jgi:predicted enzyme involved in methoxymalonyl-ACP biosynthesis